MNRKKNPVLVKKCRDQNITEFDSYYQTVIMSVGLKHIFNSNEPCVFKVNEPSMFHTSNSVTPDAIFQCDEDRKGIVCEIKTSLPLSEKYLLKDMKDQIEKYSDIKKGWKTKTGKIDDHSILLILYRTDSKKFDKLLKNWIKSGEIVTKKNLCVVDWQSIRPFKAGSKDTTLLSLRSGTTGCEYFDEKLSEDVSLDTDALSLEYETRKFVKSVPPDLYIMTILYQDVFPTFTTNQEEFTVTIEKLMKVLTDYYTSWSGLEGEQTQVRKRWIIHAMDKFVEIKIAEKNPETPFSYRIKWSKHLPKDVKEYLLIKLCGKETEIKVDEKQMKLIS